MRDTSCKNALNVLERRSDVIDVDHLSVTYDGEVPALRQADFHVAPGQIYGIIGPNGAGKSTLVKAMLGLVKHTGQVTYDGQSLKTVQAHIAYIEQRSSIDTSFPITVFDCVLTGTYPSLGWLKRPGEAEKKRALEALNQVDLLDYQDRQIGQLSGGQFQRVLIARAMAQNAQYLFLDEPFIGIDVTSERLIMDILQQLAAEGKTIFIVHHDLGSVKQYFDGVIIIKREVLAVGPVEDVFTDENLAQAFGAELIYNYQGGGQHA